MTESQAPEPPAVAPPPAAGALRQRLLGLAVAVLGYVLVLVFTLVTSSEEDGYTVLGYAVYAVGVTLLLLVAGIVLTIIERTRAFGTGLLIGTAIGVLCGGGICFGVLASI